jgi:formate hydrogenlyase subunit 6/NADH:ubiquinone oxidoreductase subunit I
MITLLLPTTMAQEKKEDNKKKKKKNPKIRIVTCLLQKSMSKKSNPHHDRFRVLSELKNKQCFFI